MVLVVNKWDLAADKADRSDFEPYLTRAIPELTYVPIVFTTAAASQGVREAVGLARELFEQARRRVSTSELNKAIAEIMAGHPPKAVAGTRRHANILYATQIDTAPPTIVCFVNNIEAFDATYRKYMLNQFRRLLPFPEVPIRLLLRPRRRDD